MNDYDFGNFICELRTKKGLSQSQLGDIMGVSNKAVSKWEMGVSKPRPAMLVALASFFGVTVEELLAGKKNEEAENREDEKRNDAILKLWLGEYRKKRKRGLGASLTAILLPVLLFVLVGVFVGLNLMDSVIGPLVTMLLLFAEIIDVALIVVFYGSARRLKRILYAIYPDQTEEITALIKPKKERVPMLRWEKVCIITGNLIFLLCNFVRFVCIFFEGKAWDIVEVAAVFIGLLAIIPAAVAAIHHSIRNYRKK